MMQRSIANVLIRIVQCCVAQSETDYHADDSAVVENSVQGEPVLPSSQSCVMLGGFKRTGRKDKQRPNSIAEGRVMSTAMAPKTAVIDE